MQRLAVQRFAHGLIIACLLLAGTAGSSLAASPEVRLVRVPHEGVQPQVVAEGKTMHLVYLRGKPDQADIEYASSKDGGETFSKPILVNSQAGSAIGLGTVRGAHLAIGKAGRLHVAWMGSTTAEPKAPGDATPMLYTRLDSKTGQFEPQRNLIQEHVGLDGGGSVAADEAGNVYVAWHAPSERGGDETQRRVWVTASTDDGRTFGAEQAATNSSSGACGCCGMRAATSADGKLWLFYRSARENVHRDSTLIEWTRATGNSRIISTDPLEASTCMMSTYAFARIGETIYAAWETSGNVYWTSVTGGKAHSRVEVPGAGGNRKHPSLAVNADGQVLVAWAQGTAWNQGGAVAWQAFGSDGEAIRGARGQSDGLPVWSLPAVYAMEDGSFRVLY